MLHYTPCPSSNPLHTASPQPHTPQVINFLLHCVSRAFEFQADGFAVGLGLGSDLRSALLRLEESNKGAMHVDALYSALHYSHPPLVERLRAIDAAIDRSAKKQQ